MPIMQDKDREQVAELFKALQNPVKLVMFTKGLDCELCKETQELVEEVASLSDLVIAEIHNHVLDKELAETYGADKVPAISVVGDKDYGIRYFGIPSGYEFTSLLADIMAVSARDSGLSDSTKAFLKDLQEPLHIQVFVTPTCPYCSTAVRLAHQMALESDLVEADMVESMEFPDLATQYQVRGVPRTIVNGSFHFEGAMPEARFIAELKAKMNPTQEAGQ